MDGMTDEDFAEVHDEVKKFSVFPLFLLAAMKI